MRRFIRALAVASIAAILAGFPAPAGANEIRVRIPFGFVVNGKVRPPGVWMVSSSGNVLVVRGPGDVVSVLASYLRSPDAGRAQLVLERHGGRYFLAEVWMAGATGYEVNPSRADRELGRTAKRDETGPDFERVMIFPSK
jgi:hypothetical protein